MRSNLLKSHHFVYLVVAFLLTIHLVVQGQSMVTLRVATHPHELTLDEIAAFEAANPDIHIELIEWDAFSIDAAVALDEVPDVLRVESPDMPQWVQENRLMDLTSYFEQSSTFQIDDLAHAADYFRFDGRYYGLPKDWSLDFSLYAFIPAFEAAGIPLPSATEPLTYAELADLARRLTQREGDTVSMYGFYAPELERTISSVLAQREVSMFNRDFTEMRLTDNPEALEVIRYFYDLTLDDALYPYPTTLDGWNATNNGQIAIFQYGYWFGAIPDAESPLYENLYMLPAPTWDRSLPRLNTTVGPIGLAISSTTEHPEESYRFFEWYTVGDGAAARASTGWGAPTLLSMLNRLPHETTFNQQRFDVFFSELPYSDWVLPIYPYQSIRPTFNEAWNRNIHAAQAGEIDFATFASNLQETVNLALLNEQLGS